MIRTLVDCRRIGKRILIHMSVDSKPHRGNGNPVTYGAGATNARSTAGCSKGSHHSAPTSRLAHPASQWAAG